MLSDVIHTLLYHVWCSTSQGQCLLFVLRRLGLLFILLIRILILSLGDPGKGRLFKLRLVIEKLRTFRKISVEECLSTEEQTCTTKGRCTSSSTIQQNPINGTFCFKWSIWIYLLLKCIQIRRVRPRIASQMNQIKEFQL